ncbi:ATP-binding cassette domain-containing protein [Devosia rhodophyticola]|uniref:ATP-binding cassette domain-containing protein n=1 Tax=Devosia rhodophyticola TaxID=3026423 RepID=A0ABY7YUI2_9HYPH|nr:ATP-binding cassette domain-containing protein [Devosia rhodophyticola]WDR05015.1 ATP-binding cassette domain-containing protein [Devosia rhodophyticola]
MANIQLKDVRKSFGTVKVIKGVDLEIKSGEFMVFVGPSGCGKSTLLRLVAGLEDITSGQLLFDGEVVNGLTPSKRGIAMVFQSYALYPHMTVYDNMAFGLTLEKGSKEQIRERVTKAADLLQIGQYLDRLPKQLSGGQRQRVAIGRAIVRDPKVFLFDEPLSNLDAALRVATRIEIAKLHEDMNSVTMIYVTHDQVEAMTLADRICVLRDGVIEQVGTPMELYETPDSLFVAGFIGSPKMNFISGEAAAAYKAHTLGIRGEHLNVVSEGGVWNGKVIHTENLGADSYVYLEMGMEEPVVVRLDGNNNYHSGDVVHVSPMEDKLHRFDEEGKPIR